MRRVLMVSFLLGFGSRDAASGTPEKTAGAHSSKAIGARCCSSLLGEFVGFRGSKNNSYIYTIYSEVRTKRPR